MTPQLMKLCGHGRPRDITSSGSTLFVALSTDGLRMDSYFHFKYRSIIAVDGKTRAHVRHSVVVWVADELSAAVMSACVMYLLEQLYKIFCIESISITKTLI